MASASPNACRTSFPPTATTNAICAPRRRAAAICCRRGSLPRRGIRRDDPAGAEDRGADPDMGRAETDRRLEIGAHPHAELVEPVAPRNLAQQREVERRFLVLRRDAHQPDDRQVQPVAALADESVGGSWQYPRLLRLLAGIDLDERGQAPPGLIHLAGQRLGETRPVD